jgi:glycosyltransferase involved in cell wall biosynthesis
VNRKLCIVSPYQHGGGAEYQIACLVTALAAAGGFDSYFLARHLSSDGEAASYRSVQIGRNGRVPRFGYAIDAWPLYRALRSIRPDVIYQRVAGGYTGLCAYYARRHGIPLVWHVSSDSDVSLETGFYGRNPLRRWLDRLAIDSGARSATHVVTQTTTQAELLLANHGRRATAIIPNFHPVPAEPLDKSGPLTVLWIANLKPLKRPEAFARMAKALADCANARFVMIGAVSYGRSEQSQLEQLQSAVGSTPNLEYVGPLPQAEVNRWLARSHLLVSTSRVEGFPNTFIQAWMRQVPVVSLDVNPDEVLDGQTTGTCVHTEAELEGTVRALLADPARLNAIGGRAQGYALSHHSMDNARQLAELLAHAKVSIK